MISQIGRFDSGRLFIFYGLDDSGKSTLLACDSYPPGEYLNIIGFRLTVFLQI